MERDSLEHSLFGPSAPHSFGASDEPGDFQRLWQAFMTERQVLVHESNNLRRGRT
jgi:hypothetical protein